ncbi:response regulator transcription factor [Ectobacillus funiculus]|uniref:response regulator n=1 Tax=Ectobacillus funiculus TaxID=137993 RepID=UPI0039790568
MEQIKIMVVDDHPFFREGLRLLLSSVPELYFIGEASSGDEAITKAIALKPDVILMDLNIPILNGIEATRKIIEALPLTGIIALTMFDDDDSVFSVMKAGAKGYLLKGVGQEETIRAIRAVYNGEAIFSQSIAGRLMSYFSSIQEKGTAHPPLPELTNREREILALIAKGLTNNELAAKLVLSPKTVRNHITNIFSKLQVADRAEAISRAKKAGL